MYETDLQPSANRQFFGELGPVRISDNIRYSGSFTPSTQWMSDDNLSCILNL